MFEFQKLESSHLQTNLSISLKHLAFLSLQYTAPILFSEVLKRKIPRKLFSNLETYI
jgi:hypothetical protein